LFPEIVEPNELQMACMNLIQGQTAPGLLVIEAPMGEGKTEAALFCMASWNLTSGHKGCFIALPTQATANQMFTRLNLFLGNYVNGPKAQLVLVHGKALLSDNYLELRMNSSKGAKPDDKVVAEEWFSYKKRGLLSPFGVGTVDQVLLASLHTKHFYLRMFGLAGKTVIIDEVHSYDLYTGTILDHTLNWLSALKANVILMSATLPTSRLEKLANSYSPGCSLNKIEYPCVRLINDEGARSVTFHTMSQKDHRRIQEIFLRWFDNNDSLYDYFLNRSDTSGSFAIIVNTVDEAQTIYTCLRPLEKMGYDVMLLHSRFIFKRRDELERRAISKFDKHSIGMSRNGILVSTQIIEQSLDLDFDSIYTKLAPIDLVLQRAGRLHRHVREGRPADLDAPVLNIILPKMVDDQPDFGKDIFVYDEYVLLRTWLFLRDQERIVLPSDLRVGVESVYGPLASSVDERIADRLDRARAQMQRWEDGVREKASHRLVVPPNSEIVWTRHDDLLNDGVNDSEDEVQGLTRLGRPSIEVILLFDNGHEPCLDPDGNAPLSALDASSSDYARIILDNSLRLSNHDVVTSMMAIPKEERHWTDDSLLRSYTPLVMHKVAGNWTHRLGEVLLVYDHDVGMRYAKVI
jgi:CRISPR-associated endonuclease/helicase Cas3